MSLETRVEKLEKQMAKVVPLLETLSAAVGAITEVHAYAQKLRKQIKELLDVG